MEIKVIQFSDIVPDDYNPRKALTPADPEYQKIKASLQTFGAVEPIVFNRRTGHIVGGHQRIEIMKAEGATEAAASVVDIDDRDERLLNVSLNKIRGRWDYKKLEDILAGFDTEEAKIAGFDPDELAVILADNGDIEDPYSGLYGEEEDDYWNEDDGPEDFVGASWVVTLKFSSFEFAKQWMLLQDFPNTPSPGTTTTVVRMR